MLRCFSLRKLKCMVSIQLCLESRTHKVINMSMDRVIAVITAVYVVPDVRNTVLCKAVVIAVRCCINDLVIASCCHEQKMRLFAALPLEIACYTGCRADSSDISEEVGALHADKERLASAH